MSEIDLRSDTVTKPSQQMRKEIANADLGDDVYGEDPTINKLQELAAEKLGFEAGLLLPSGSMGNQVAIWVHTESGQEAIVEKESHIYNYEMGTMSAFSGVTPRPAPSEKGIPSLEDVKREINPDKYYLPDTGLIALENTHNNRGGRILPQKRVQEIVEFARAQEIPVHLDGARLFNAAVELGIEPGELTKGFDSAMFCLSKGLGAPVGSMLVGSDEFIQEARVGRKMFGGGMRQAGILAAAGIYALRNNIGRLKKDHENAKRLGRKLEELGFELTPKKIETNIFFANVKTADVNAFNLAEHLEEQGIIIGPRDSDNIRFVTHLDVDKEDISDTVAAIKDFLTR